MNVCRGNFKVIQGKIVAKIAKLGNFEWKGARPVAGIVWLASTRTNRVKVAVKTASEVNKRTTSVVKAFVRHVRPVNFRVPLAKRVVHRAQKAIIWIQRAPIILANLVTDTTVNRGIPQQMAQPGVQYVRVVKYVVKRPGPVLIVTQDSTWRQGNTLPRVTSAKKIKARVLTKQDVWGVNLANMQLKVPDKGARRAPLEGLLDTVIAPAHLFGAVVNRAQKASKCKSAHTGL